MRTVYIQADDDGSIQSLTEEDYGFPGYEPVEIDDGFDVMVIDDYRLVDGALSYTGEGTAAREEAEKEAQAEEKRRAVIDDGCQEFFVDGGRAEMERAIEEAAQSVGGDPQIATIARLLTPSIDFATVTATDVAAIPDYIPAWEDVGYFTQNDPCTYKGTIYRASQAHDRQDIYPPDVAGESMYYPIKVAPDGVIVYRTCHGDYDKVRKGERRHYPDADGPVYEALEDTSYSPDAYPRHWALEGSAEALSSEIDDEVDAAMSRIYEIVGR